MRRLFTILFLGSFFLSTSQELDWVSDFGEAKKQANKQEKLIFMRFTGSDWCANCIRIDTTLLEKPSFKSFAEDQFIFLYLDFPSKKENALPEAQVKHNQKLLEKYNPAKAFPAIIILDRRGQVLGQMNVRPNSTEGYINLIREILD